MNALSPDTAVRKHLAVVTGEPGIAPHVIWQRFSEIEEESIRWIWQDWIAGGKLHLMAGVQGDGKSTVAANIAACLSSGEPLPNGVRIPPVRVGFLVSEDGIADTVRPRLRIHGADLDNVLAIQAVRTDAGDHLLSFTDHLTLTLLEQFIVDEGITVLIVDALSDFMGGIKRNDEGEVRSVLTPLAQLAGRTGCAIVGIVHLGKPGAGARRAIERVLGSGAFTQIARIVWAVSVDPEEESRRFFGQVKNNLAPDVPTLCWHRDRDMPISWDGFADASVKAMMSGSHERTTKSQIAQTFLSDLLKDGSKASADVFDKGKAAGIGRDALYAAANALNVIKEKEARVGGQWHWSLPAKNGFAPSYTHVSSGSLERSVPSGSSGSLASESPELPDDPYVPNGAQGADSDDRPRTFTHPPCGTKVIWGQRCPMCEPGALR